MIISVVLKSGGVFQAEFPNDYTVEAVDLTAKTVHKFVLVNQDIMFVQGDNISHFYQKKEDWPQ